MCCEGKCIAMLRAFKEITQSLIGLLSVYDSDPQLVQDIAHTLRDVFRTHIERHESNPETKGAAALHELLKEIDTAIDEIESNA